MPPKRRKPKAKRAEPEPEPEPEPLTPRSPWSSPPSSSSLYTHPSSSPPGTYSYQDGLRKRKQSSRYQVEPELEPDLEDDLEEEEELPPGIIEEEEEGEELPPGIEEEEYLEEEDFDRNYNEPDIYTVSDSSYIPSSSYVKNNYSYNNAWQRRPYTTSQQTHLEESYQNYLHISDEYYKNYIIANQKLLLLFVGVYCLVGPWLFGLVVLAHYIWYKCSGIRLSSWPFGHGVGWRVYDY